MVNNAVSLVLPSKELGWINMTYNMSESAIVNFSNASNLIPCPKTVFLCHYSGLVMLVILMLYILFIISVYWTLQTITWLVMPNNIYIIVQQGYIYNITTELLNNSNNINNHTHRSQNVLPISTEYNVPVEELTHVFHQYYKFHRMVIWQRP